MSPKAKEKKIVLVLSELKWKFIKKENKMVTWFFPFKCTIRNHTFYHCKQTRTAPKLWHLPSYITCILATSHIEINTLNTAHHIDTLQELHYPVWNQNRRHQNRTKKVNVDARTGGLHIVKTRMNMTGSHTKYL